MKPQKRKLNHYIDHRYSVVLLNFVLLNHTDHKYHHQNLLKDYNLYLLNQAIVKVTLFSILLAKANTKFGLEFVKSKAILLIDLASRSV